MGHSHNLQLKSPISAPKPSHYKVTIPLRFPHQNGSHRAASDSRPSSMSMHMQKQGLKKCPKLAMALCPKFVLAKCWAKERTAIPKDLLTGFYM